MGTVRGRPSKAAWLLAFALCLVVSQLSVWTWTRLRYSARVRHDRLQERANQAELAESLLRLRTQDGLAMGLSAAQAGQRAQEGLQPLFPNLSFAHGERVGPRVDAALEVEQAFRRRVRGSIAEGGAFLLVVMAGAWLWLRALRREQALDNQTANFVAAVTHELKSPLTSLQLWLQTLARRPPSPAALREALTIMQGDIDRLDRLIGNVLQASRLQAKMPNQRGVRRRAQSSPQRCDVVAVCTTEVQALRAQAVQHNVAIEWHAPGHPIWAAIAIADVQLVVRNLLDNAIKYGGAAAQLALSQDATSQTMQIAVHDRGRGLAKGDLARVFERFVRVGDEMVRQSPGTGLGLYLVRTTAELGGGRTWAQSAGEGQGSSFFVQLPLAQPPR